MQNLYEILGLKSNATQTQIKKSYKQLAAINHPDKGGNAELMAEINKAYEVLSNEESKKAYDETGFTGIIKDRKVEIIEGLQRMLIESLNAIDPTAVNALEFMRKHIEEGQRMNRQLIANAHASIQRYQKAAYRIKTEKENFLNDALNGAIEQKRKDIQAIEEKILSNDEYLVTLLDFDWELSAAKVSPFNLIENMETT